MATDLALPAFLSSAYGSRAGCADLLPEGISYQEIQEAEAKWKDTLNNNCEPPATVAVQAQWDQPLFNKKYQDWLDNTSGPTEKARLLAVAYKNSSD